MAPIVQQILVGVLSLTLLCVEGSIAMGPDGTGLFDTFDGKPKRDLVFELCAAADYVLALGTCASYGGITAAPPNPTAAVGLQYADGQPGGLLGKDWRSAKGLPVVNVAVFALLIEGVPFTVSVNACGALAPTVFVAVKVMA